MTLAVGLMTYNGITIGPGGQAQLVDVNGLTGLPANRSGDVSRPNADGMLAGYDFMGARTVTIDLEVPVANIETVRQAFLMGRTTGGGMNPPASQVLVFNFGQGSGGVGVNRQVTARCRKFDDTVDVAFAAGNWTAGIVSAAAQLVTVDPLIYDASTQTASVPLSTSSGGFTFPAAFPAGFGSQSGGLITAVNFGTVACPPLLTITGPCVTPRVQQQTSGVTLQFNTTLNSGDTLVVDCWAGSAILNGTASRLNVLAPGSFITAFQIQPGSNTLGFYSSDASPTGATLTAKWSNCWA